MRRVWLARVAGLARAQPSDGSHRRRRPLPPFDGEVTINLRVLSRPQESFLPEIFSNLGLDYDEVLRALASRRSHAAGAGARGPALACTAPHSA